MTKFPHIVYFLIFHISNLYSHIENAKTKKLDSPFYVSPKFCFFALLKYCKLCVNYHYY